MSFDVPVKVSATLEAGIKPGWKTTEFYFSKLAALLSMAYALGWIGDAGTVGRVAAIAAFALTTFGYTVSRGMAKSAAVTALQSGQQLEPPAAKAAP